MKKITLKSFDECPALDYHRKELGMSRDEYIQHVEKVIAPNLKKTSASFTEYAKDRISDDGKFITKYDKKTGEHVTTEIKTGKEVGRKRIDFIP